MKFFADLRKTDFSCLLEPVGYSPSLKYRTISSYFMESISAPKFPPKRSETLKEFLGHVIILLGSRDWL